MNNKNKTLIIIFVCFIFFIFAMEFLQAESESPKVIMIDGHTHDIVPRSGSDPVQSGIERLKRAGVGGVILAFPLNSANPDNLITQITNEIEFVKKYATKRDIKIEFVQRFSTRQEQNEPQPIQILSSIEYFDSLFDNNLDNIEKLKNAGISAITLIDNEYNRLSENINGKPRLSSNGKKIIRKLNNAGIVIDISHLPELVRLEVIAESKKPVFASHSNMRHVADVPRNISDTVMKQLIKKGGIVLLTFDREYLFGDKVEENANGIAKLIEHIDYVTANFGVDYVGNGTDYGGSGRNTTNDLFGVECFPKIAEQLMKKGYTAEQVNKIMGGNTIRFFSSMDK